MTATTGMSRVSAGLLLFGFALAIRLVGLDQLPRFDELYTLPAAQHMATEGVPRIAHGVYDRAILYTAGLGAWFRLIGHDDIVAARIPSVLFGCLLVVAVFWWTDREAGRAPAWIAGLFVALSPLAIEMSQFARFYTLHALVFWIGAVAMYDFCTSRHGPRLWVAAIAVLALALAQHLQLLTALGVAGLLVWVGVSLSGLLLRLPARWAVAVALAGVVVAAVLLLLAGGPLQALLDRYLETPLTVIQHRGEIWFYHMHLIERWPTLWPVLPFLAIVAVAAQPAPATFALCVFGVVFGLESIGGQKSWRYLYFALPFLFVVWAIGLAALWPVLRASIAVAMDRMLEPVPERWRRSCRIGLVAMGCIFLVVANGSSARTLLRPFGLQLGEGLSADWPAAVPTLKPLVAEADLVVTSNELHMLYYVGRADLVLSKERLAEFSDTEPGIDPRTGLAVIRSAGVLEMVMDCYERGLIVTDTIKGWREPTVIDESVSDVIRARRVPVPLPPQAHIRAFEWHTPAPLPDRCQDLPAWR